MKSSTSTACARWCLPLSMRRSLLQCGLAWLVLSCTQVHGASDWQLLREDVSALCTPSSAVWIGASLVGGLLVHPLDSSVKGSVDLVYIEPLLDAGNLYLDSVHALSGAVALRLVAQGWGSEEAIGASSHMLRALVLANAMVAPLKLGVGRRRPDGSNRLSFPSGHSANAFALATALARRYGGRVAVPAYALAALVPVARIHERHHYLSDVVTGAGLGTLAGWISARASAGRGLTLVPARLDEDWTLSVRWTY